MTVLSILYSSTADGYDKDSAYSNRSLEHHVNSPSDESMIKVLTERIQDIKTRMSNPALPKSERQMLQRELELLTDMLSKALTRSTNTGRAF